MNVADKFGLTGRQAEIALREARFTVNRNAIPFDKNGPWYTSGVRVGTAATTTLGMKEAEMQQIARSMVALLKSCCSAVSTKSKELSRVKVEIDPVVLETVREEITAILSQFPLYPELILK